MKDAVLTVVVFAALIAGFGLAANDGRLPWTEEPARPADWCEPHGVALAECEMCNPKLARGGTFATQVREPREGECPNTLVQVTLAPGAAERVGIEVDSAAPRRVTETLRASAETRHDPARFARVAPRVAGVVREVLATLGQEVEASTPLAVIESQELGEAKSEHLQNLAVLDLRQRTHDAEKVLADKRITPGRDLLGLASSLEEARIAVRRSSQRLSLLGLSDAQVAEVASKQDTSARLPVFAPFAGTVLEAPAVVGETAGPDRPLFAVADLDRMWLRIDVLESDLARLEKGQKVTFTVEGLAGRRFTGRVLAVGGEVDERTRTVGVVADLKNAERLLRAHMFGRAEVLVSPPEAKLLVPKAAVQNDGDCDLLFVRTSADVFQARKVELGAAYEGGYEIRGGLAAGEAFATTGSFLLKTEVMRGQLGAG